MKGNFLILIISSIFLALVLCSFVSAITGNIGNARMVLYPEVGFFGATIEKSILVKNVNNVSVNISLEASDEDFAKMVTILDSNFVLLPGENKDAQFEIKIKKTGDYEGKINVFFKPAEGKGAGVALPSTIIIHAGGTDSEVDDDPEENDGNLTDIWNSPTTSSNKKININPAYFLIIFPIILIVILVFMLTKLNRKKKRR